MYTHLCHHLKLVFSLLTCLWYQINFGLIKFTVVRKILHSNNRLVSKVVLQSVEISTDSKGSHRPSTVLVLCRPWKELSLLINVQERGWTSQLELIWVGDSCGRLPSIWITCPVLGKHIFTSHKRLKQLQVSVSHSYCFFLFCLPFLLNLLFKVAFKEISCLSCLFTYSGCSKPSFFWHINDNYFSKLTNILSYFTLFYFFFT